MRLALFDLVHTLVPFDSTLVWLRHLAGHGEIDAGRDDAYLDCCRQYVAGVMDVGGLHACALAPLGQRRVDEIAGWQARFEAEVLPAALPPAARSLIARHRERGDVCCLVTNTSDVVAAPFARALGLSELIASRAQRAGEQFTGAIDGEPCHGFGKVRHVGAWLARRGLDWRALAWSGFYSDSISDLPLLSYVAEPVAVRPDEGLRAHALAEGWRIAETLQDA